MEDDEWEFLGFIGNPGIGERPTELGAEISDHRFVNLDEPLLSVQAVHSSPGVWLALDCSGCVHHLDTASGSGEAVLQIEPSIWNQLVEGTRRELNSGVHEHPTMFITSASGRHVAALMARNQYGWAIDLKTGFTLELDRGNSHTWAYDFAAAFVTVEGREVLVHATAWNRLDVTDPATGERLTERGPTHFSGGEDRPSHYLDYFHARLYPSPRCTWIADDGWVWHPIGVVTAWSLPAWLKNVWESEDGESKAALARRSYYWGGPFSWIDDDTLAISGIGFDDEYIIPGVRVFDVASATERTAFAGPEGELFSVDCLLISEGPGGMVVWDPVTGERLGVVAGFLPRSVHPETGEFIEISGTGVRTCRLTGLSSS